MFIASIDPGVTTGLVIAFIKPRNDILTIKIHSAADAFDPFDVVKEVMNSHYRCRNIVMEQKPSRPSKEGSETWEMLFRMFTIIHAYKDVSGSDLLAHVQHKHRTLFLVQPSHWKPFMRNRRSLLPPTTPHHARDAFQMLHYFIQISYPDKEIVYAK